MKPDSGFGIRELELGRLHGRHPGESRDPFCFRIEIKMGSGFRRDDRQKKS
jgi:hypothetical protein